MRTILIAAVFATITSPSVAAPCAIANLSTYLAPAFSCEAGGVSFSNFNLSTSGNPNAGASEIVVTPEENVGGGFRFTSPTPTAIAGQNGFGSSGSDATYRLMYFGQIAGPFFLTGVVAGLQDLQTDGVGSWASYSKEVRTGVALGDFSASAGTILGQSLLFFGASGSGVDLGADVLNWQQLVHIVRVLDEIDISGAAGIAEIANAPYSIVVVDPLVPEPATAVLIGCGVVALAILRRRGAANSNAS
jgi:hypothetical protein